MRAILVSLSGLALVLTVGCGGGNDNSDDFPKPQCSDGKDNDGDGSVDFPDDLGCTSENDDSEDSPTSSQCQDGRDNDGDGKIDYPADPGCFAPQADSETDDCPDGPNCPECADGKDNDGNGAMDYPNDPGCESASDDQEFPMNSVACGATMKIETLPATRSVDGMLDGTSTSLLVSPCGGGGGSPARAYVLHLDEPKVVELSTDDGNTTADTIIDLRAMNCMEQSAEIACNDDISASNSNSKLTAPLQAGNYYIIVSGVDSATSGAFHLQVKLYNGEGTTCADAGDCGPGLVCRTPHGGSSDVCSKPVCSDGLDDDGDGKTDYPNDPGCTTPDDSDETDTCPNGASCPECGDGVDNDSDGKTDYPNDPTCKAAGDASESCTSSDGVQLITQPMTPGDTSTATHDITPSCGYSASMAGDRTYRLDLPALVGLDLEITSTNYLDTVTVLYDSTCGGTPIKCSDPSLMHLDTVAAGTYYFVVDGYSTSAVGPYTINVTGKIANGGSCESALAQSGALTCGAGYACKGTAGSRTCQLALCGDGIDNDGDGKIDYPNDPGCDSIADDTENDPATPPVCADGMDNDSDGLIDYPADYGCTAASGTTEVFCPVETDPTALITSGKTSGTTIGKTHNLAPTCAASTATANDVVYALVLPVPVDTLVIDTIDSALPTADRLDTIIAVRTPACGATDLACNDDGGGLPFSKLTMNNVAPGSYAILVDGYGYMSSGTPGVFTLNVKGTVGANTSCTSPLFSGATPVLYCPTGTTCSGGANARCQ